MNLRDFPDRQTDLINYSLYPLWSWIHTIDWNAFNGCNRHLYWIVKISNTVIHSYESNHDLEDLPGYRGGWSLYFKQKFCISHSTNVRLMLLQTYLCFGLSKELDFCLERVNKHNLNQRPIIIIMIVKCQYTLFFWIKESYVKSTIT